MLHSHCYRPANLLIRTDSEPEVRGSSVRSGIFFDSKQDMCLSRHDKFHTSSSKFRVRLGCRGCSGVKNHLLGCMYRIRPGMIFRAGARYAPSHQFFHRPFSVTSLSLIRIFPSSGFKADLDTILKEILWISKTEVLYPATTSPCCRARLSFWQEANMVQVLRCTSYAGVLKPYWATQPKTEDRPKF